MKYGLACCVLWSLSLASLANAEPRSSWGFAFDPAEAAGEQLSVDREQPFDAATGYGWSPELPNQFKVQLPEGNYSVEVEYADNAAAANSFVKAEARRLVLAPDSQLESYVRSFTVNVRRPVIEGGKKVRLRSPGDVDSATWDDCLSLEFYPDVACVRSIHIRPVDHAITVYVAGDSTVTDQTNEPWAGWGQMLPRFFQPGVAVANHAESGRALYSFRGERRLAKVLSTIQPGDYLFIQFGHNDQKDKSHGAGPFTSYREDLVEYIQDTRAARANPVLVTPMERRRWSDGTPDHTLADYAQAVREVGKEQHVPVIDLNAMSLQLYAALGEADSKHAFVHYAAHTFPGQDKALQDDTHHNAYGAYELARCVVEGIKQHVPALAKHLRADAASFDPAHPDPVGSLGIPPSLLIDSTKPEGN